MLAKKLAKSCGAIAKLQHCMDTKLLVGVYHSLIQSHLRYGIVAWGTASEVNLQPLKILVNRAIRIITFAPFGRVDLKPIYSFLKVLDIDKVYSLETTCPRLIKITLFLFLLETISKIGIILNQPIVIICEIGKNPHKLKYALPQAKNLSN